MVTLAVGLAFDLPATVQRLIPDCTAAIQDRLSPTVGSPLSLGGLVTAQNRELSHCTEGATRLQECGPAPALRDVTAWLNSPPLTLAQPRGRVVLIDFWAYSCINCRRALPHIIQLNDTYRSDGLVVIGVHTPEYAFERVRANVRAGITEDGIDHPVAMDNAYATWTAHRNRFWPAQYLIDANGEVRHLQQGEGGYATTESLARQLLDRAHPGVALPPPVEGASTAPTPGSTTPETFLGVSKQLNCAGSQTDRSGAGTFSYPASQRPDSFALTSGWTLDSQRIVPDARPGRTPGVRLEVHAHQVQVVVGAPGPSPCTVRPETRPCTSSETRAPTRSSPHRRRRQIRPRSIPRRASSSTRSRSGDRRRRTPTR